MSAKKQSFAVSNRLSEMSTVFELNGKLHSVHCNDERAIENLFNVVGATRLPPLDVQRPLAPSAGTSLSRFNRRSNLFSFVLSYLYWSDNGGGGDEFDDDSWRRKSFLSRVIDRVFFALQIKCPPLSLVLPPCHLLPSTTKVSAISFHSTRRLLAIAMEDLIQVTHCVLFLRIEANALCRTTTPHVD